MPASSNFNQAIREAQTRAIVGPNVVQKALPYVGGGMGLTAFGALGGLTLSQNPYIRTPIFCSNHCTVGFVFCSFQRS